MRILQSPHLLSHMDIIAPKYSGQYTEAGDWLVLLKKRTVDHASGIIIIDFRAKHLHGQRWCVDRTVAAKCPVVSNGKVECYQIEMSKLDGWQSAREVHDIAMTVFE